MKTISKGDITAVILAGGQARRMNGADKGLMLFRGKPLISYVADAVRGSVKNICVSANKNLNQYRQFGEVITDNLPDFQGPLAGISATLGVIKTKYLLVVPCDGPYVEKILVERLANAMIANNTRLCVAIENNNLHPTFALIDVNVKSVLDEYLANGERKLGKFFKDNQSIEVDFSDYKKMFVNFNYVEDLTDN
jgi:molybdopterin-guanine dinucleotide biosynthesis protein A